ncbi:hypothetical protein Tco_1029502 [Tanacetum coccineum]|uniref:Uncharacterized protein n=1 Tax=Tanacetum coccineum TaxID=301880 RepID=A0ABQ5G3L8_9ASTR
MTRSSTKKLLTPFEEPKRVFHSTRKLFKTLSLDYSSLPEFDLFSNLENQSENEVTEAMAEPTMEEYMMKTREDYGSGIARPKIDENAHFELKGQFLMELHDNTFSGSDNDDANKHIEKVLEIGAIPSKKAADAKKKVNERVYAAQVGCELYGGPHYTKDCQLKEEGKIFEEAYYTQFGVPFPQGGRYRATALGFYQRDNENPLYQERRQTMEELLSKFMAESANRHDENSNMIKEIQATTDAAIRNQRASIKALEIQIRQISKLTRPQYAVSIPSDTPRNQVEDLGPTIEKCEVNDEPMEDIVETRNEDNEISNGIDEYPSFCDLDRKIHIDCAYNLKFLCMIVIENMDVYRDEGMGAVIVGKPFCREICIKASRFDGMIIIYNGNDGVSAHDKLNEISHPYQKIKSFYKGVLNLGPEYIRDAQIEVLITRGHVSIHEME